MVLILSRQRRVSDGWMLRSRCSVRNICARNLYVPRARKDDEVMAENPYAPNAHTILTHPDGRIEIVRGALPHEMLMGPDDYDESNYLSKRFIEYGVYFLPEETEAARQAFERYADENYM